MIRTNRFVLTAVFAIILPMCLAISTGCSKPDDVAGTSAAPAAPVGRPPGAPEGPGMGRGQVGPGGPGGGTPLAANASGQDIFATKCAGCHGADGKGVRGPALAKAASDSEDAITKVIHDGKGKMPAFGSQLCRCCVRLFICARGGFGRVASCT